MKYLLLQYANETAMMNLPGAEAGRVRTAHLAYIAAMNEAGVLVANYGLRPTSEATTVRAPGGRQSVMDGPYAGTNERLGGCFLIEVPDLDAAISWAARCPAIQHGAIEVRPVRA